MAQSRFATSATKTFPHHALDVFSARPSVYRSRVPFLFYYNYYVLFGKALVENIAASCFPYDPQRGEAALNLTTDSVYQIPEEGKKHTTSLR